MASSGWAAAAELARYLGSAVSDAASGGSPPLRWVGLATPSHQATLSRHPTNAIALTATLSQPCPPYKTVSDVHVRQQAAQRLTPEQVVSAEAGPGMLLLRTIAHDAERLSHLECDATGERLPHLSAAAARSLLIDSVISQSALDDARALPELQKSLIEGHPRIAARVRERSAASDSWMRG